ncbi:MAG: hypothetical protein CMK07_03580 [Ponticaulis sp.]|nr:hypothetical protein [Ponticaulis sp.]
MVFSDRAFLFLFLPIALAVILLLSKVKLRFISILVLSFLFYFYSAGIIIWVLAACIILSYLAGLWLDRHKSPWILAVSLITLFLPLLFYKYSFFIAKNVGISAESDLGSFLNVALPAGISFFTFQAVSYVVDVYRGEVKADRNLLRYGAYLSFFPQLIAGPIVRYKDVDDDFKADHQSPSRFSEGILRFLHGLMKKLIIADNAGRIADACFGLDNSEVGFLTALIGATAYTIQIYFDFSGYSDMAIGLGKMFGIRFPENFKAPYQSRSITEFWRRWHVTLSNWFRDYLYISLGGNRVAPWRLYVNLMIVFAATGIWHGAAWTFVIWGLYHGAFILLERAVFGNNARRLGSELARYIYLLPVVIVGWIIFRAGSIDQAWTFISALAMPLGEDAFTMPNEIWAALTPSAVLATLVGCLSFIKWTEKPVGVWLEDRMHLAGWKWLCFAYILISMVVVAVASLATNFSPFLYFQF